MPVAARSRAPSGIDATRGTQRGRTHATPNTATT